MQSLESPDERVHELLSRILDHAADRQRDDRERAVMACKARGRRLTSPLPLWERSDRIARCDPGEGLRSIVRPQPFNPTLSRFCRFQ
jgi:hypothetical protein